VFIGIDSLRAAALVELGWREPLSTGSLIHARSQARLEAALNGGVPVVVMQKETASGAASFEVYEVCVRDKSPKRNLGFSETAGLADILSSILDAAHTHLRNAIDVGRGEKNVEIPALRGLLHRKDDNDTPSRKKRGIAPTLKQIKQAHRIGMGHLKRIKTSLNNMLHRGKKSAATPTQAPTPAVKRVRRIPQAGGNSVPRTSKVAKVPGSSTPSASNPATPAQNFGPGNPDPAQYRVAKQTVEVRGMIGTKRTSATISAGSRYRLVPSGIGTILMRVGTPPMVISPGDLAKL